MSIDKFKSAIAASDVLLVRAMAIEHPEYLTYKMNWNFGDNAGSALSYAAYCDKPEVICCLIGELDVDADRQKESTKKWTALHVACKYARKKAVKALLDMGANPSVKDECGETPLDYCTDVEINKIMATAVETFSPLPPRVNKPAPQETGWELTAPDEVASTRLVGDRGYKLTEIFNFTARRVTALALDLKSRAIAQTFTYFDDVPDKQVLLDAHAHLRALGGTVDVGSVHRRALEGKSRLKGVDQ